MQKSGLSGIIESQEQELGVLVEQSEGGQDVPDLIWASVYVSISLAHDQLATYTS